MARYTLDHAASRFTVQAFASGMLSGFGHNPTFAIRDFSGELQFASETAADTSLHLTVRAASLALLDSVSDKDRAEIESRMQQEVLETARYPEMIFQSSECRPDRVADNWFRLRLLGELRLHGVAKQQAVDAQLRIVDDEARLNGECRLLLSAFQMKPVSALGGLIKLKDELKFSFELIGRKNDER